MDEKKFGEFGPNAGYVKELYELYKRRPELVDESWARIFGNGHKELGQISGRALRAALSAQERVTLMVRNFRARGHLRAALSPLLTSQKTAIPPELTLAYYQFSQEELSGVYQCDGFQGSQEWPLSDLIMRLEAVYCGKTGFEFEHLYALEEREWWREAIEQEFSARNWFSNEDKRHFLYKLIEAEHFDSELHKRYLGSKRFSLRGAETLSPMLERLLDQAGERGVDEVLLGMSHRGRLNILGTLAGTLLSEIVADFEDKSIYSVIGFGDVKYHLGHETELTTRFGKKLRFMIASNPSHLEAVNGAIEGMVRARQDIKGTDGRKKVLGILVHGDAAFSGQGMVYEVLNYSQVAGYSVGGTIHVIVNNQLGFTTNPEEGRSSVYCTEAAKVIDAPVIHVNSEDVEACCWAMQKAMEYRDRFHKDVFLDLYCYRKFGHNEGDDPSFTQPLMYAEISRKKELSEIYAGQLTKERVVSAAAAPEMEHSLKERYAEAMRPENLQLPGEACPLAGRLISPEPATPERREVLLDVAHALTAFPGGFKPHAKLKGILEKRVRSVEEGREIDWGTVEALAFGSLVHSGVHVRLSGQDSGRGTFSQRHLELHHFEKAERFYPLAEYAKRTNAPANFEVYDSTLSEAGVLAFEFGYAAEAPERLVLWEAQFGDFVNGAQVIVDQFIATSESKWGQLSGVTMLLPHGYEGQGPEHSSGRLERFLHLGATGNIRVCYPSSAAQYFHLLRRQGLSGIKRPLVVMTPKSLLRSPKAAASIGELTGGGFRSIIEESRGAGRAWQHVLFMSGKIYYDVCEALDTQEPRAAVRIIRIEELYPFPEEALRKALRGVKALSFQWVQEEPKNMGAFDYVESRLRALTSAEVHYNGRGESSSTATGSYGWHQREQREFLAELLRRIAL